MTSKADVKEADGIVAHGFEQLAQVFNQSSALKEGGAALSIHIDGEPVVKLWGGKRSLTERSDTWSEDTLVNLFSISKTVTALCMLYLADQKKICIDDPISRHWPEFGANGKQEITIKQALSHSSGVPGIRQKLNNETLFDWRQVCCYLERETPWWPPGTKRGVHALVYGHLIGEVIRRVTGTSIGAFWQSELAPSLDADLFIGVPEGEQPRIADMIGFSLAEKSMYFSDQNSLLCRVMTNPPAGFDPEILNSPAWRSAEIPAVNGHGTAEAVARVYDLFALCESNPKPVISAQTLQEAMRVQTEGWDEVVGRPKCWCLGVQAHGTTGSVAMAGLGGSFALANPAVGTSFAFLTNRMGDFRDSVLLLNALSKVLGFQLE